MFSHGFSHGYLVQFKESSLAQGSDGSSGHGRALILMNGNMLAGDGEIRQSLESVIKKVLSMS